MATNDVSESNLALFCDYENVALGVQDKKLKSFEVSLVLSRLLDKGKIVVKKAYADWERYKSARRPLHEAAFELIEIPHVSYSGKNSADIRLVVDALDLCYTKGHVDTFVVISGDSDFSPLVSKLRENAKRVIGLGVKDSTSDLLVDNCDEFIFYDDLVSQTRRAKSATRRRGGKKAAKTDEAKPKPESDTQSVALDLVVDTVEALFRDRSDDAMWGSLVKQTLKRKRPHFSETSHGYRNFNQLLEDAESRGLLQLQKDARSGGYLVLGVGAETAADR